jgi:hypothetical protein
MPKPRGLVVALLLASSLTLALVLVTRGDAPTHARAAAGGTPLSLDDGFELPLAPEPEPRLPDAAVPAVPPRPPPVAPPLEEPRERKPPATVSDLAAAGGWMKSLAVHEALPRLLTPEAELRRLEGTLAQATNPVARQNILFLAVLTLPTEVSHPWLRSVMTGGPGGDAEDALLALAFDGDPAARFRFADLSRASSRAPVHRLLDTVYDHEALGESGTDEAREVLRSYRAIEVLDRDPYFDLTFHNVRHAPWLSHPTWTPDLARDVLASWIARYPGHPGSDDMALRLGRIEIDRGAPLEAARWLSRSATMPDQDVCEVAVRDLVAVCELLLSPEELDLLAHEQGYLTPNRTLVQYIRLRRLAAERGFAVAILYAEALGRDEPLSVLGYAWNHRYGAEVPRGLGSGLLPLPADDPLRAMEESVPPFERPEGSPVPRRIPGYLGTPPDKARLDPYPERLPIDATVLMRQFRAWEAIVELERRATRAHGHARSDLLYKVAAVFYHEPHAIFPAYGNVCDFGGVLWLAERKSPASYGTFVRTSLPLLRAIRIFEEIEREDPSYGGIDKVIYSKGVAWARLEQYGFTSEDSGDGPPERHPYRTKVRNAVQDLERCAAAFPRSPLADDAVRLATYWRNARPDAFE